ncbi:MAG: nitroreductase family protein [Methanothrix sp.]|nr:nitroreductase family protein [Methanothrix sp.]
MALMTVDGELCTRCGICTAVCTANIIESGVESGDEIQIPRASEERAGFCFGCGHCEAFCPSQALILNIRPDERIKLPQSAGKISAEDIGWYLQKRRSVRRFTDEPVSKEMILKILDIARYAPSGSNGQPVSWLVVHDPKQVKKIAEIVIEYMKSLANTDHPLKGYLPMLISAWDRGEDIICRGAPHLLFAIIPEGNPIAPVDAIIALTHFDIVAPAFGVGTCWAGFLAMAADAYQPLQEELCIPSGKKSAYAMMFGHPRYKTYGIPRRNPLQLTWLE